MDGQATIHWSLSESPSSIGTRHEYSVSGHMSAAMDCGTAPAISASMNSLNHRVASYLLSTVATARDEADTFDYLTADMLMQPDLCARMVECGLVEQTGTKHLDAQLDWDGDVLYEACDAPVYGLTQKAVDMAARMLDAAAGCL